MIRNLGISFFAALAFIVVVRKAYQGPLSGECLYTSIPAKPWSDVKNPGKLLAGEAFRQTILLPDSLFASLVHPVKTAVVTLSMLFATFARTNSCLYSINIYQAHIKIGRKINCRDMQDNDFLHIGFTVNEFRQLKPGKAILELKSINGNKKNAVTAWLSKDTSNGSAVLFRNGAAITGGTKHPFKAERQNQSLVFSLGTPTTSKDRKRTRLNYSH